MHQFLPRPGRLKQGVIASGHFTQAWANGNDQVALFDARGQLGIQPNAHIACIQRVVVVKGVLKPEGVADRQLPVFCKPLQRLRGLGSPAAAAGNDQRAL